VHDVEFGAREVILNETLPALRELQAEGKTRWIGITGLPVELLAQLARAFPVDSVLSYCHYNLLNREMQHVLFPLGDELGLGLINASVLHMGILTEGGPQPWHPAPEPVKAMGRELSTLCRSRGADIAEVGLKFALATDKVATTLVGMAQPELVRANVRVLESPLDAQLVAELERALQPVLNETWHEGLPANAPSRLR